MRRPWHSSVIDYCRRESCIGCVNIPSRFAHDPSERPAHIPPSLGIPIPFHWEASPVENNDGLDSVVQQEIHALHAKSYVPAGEAWRNRERGSSRAGGGPQNSAPPSMSGYSPQGAMRNATQSIPPLGHTAVTWKEVVDTAEKINPIGKGGKLVPHVLYGKSWMYSCFFSFCFYAHHTGSSGFIEFDNGLRFPQQQPTAKVLLCSLLLD